MVKGGCILCILVMVSLGPIFAQEGYLGKRLHLGIDTRLSPAWAHPDHDGKKGFFKWNYQLMPFVEYVIDKNWVMGLQYQFYNSKFETGDSPAISEEPVRMLDIGDVKVNGVSIYGKSFLEYDAPLGYYMKYQLDVLFFKTRGMAEEYEWEQNRNTIFEYTQNDWMFGVQIGMGRTFFIGEFCSLSTGISMGFTTKGYPIIKGFSNREVSPVDWAADRIWRSYLFGIHLGVGFIPF